MPFTARPIATQPTHVMLVSVNENSKPISLR